MKRDTGQPKIVWRDQGGTPRAYLDARRFGVKGRIPLKPAGSTRCTTDPVEAQRLAVAKLRELEMVAQAQAVAAEATRLRHARLGLDEGADLVEYGDEHLQRKEQAGRYARVWLDNLARYLDRANTYFNAVQVTQARTPTEAERCAAPRNLLTISPVDVRAYMRWLQGQDNGRGGTQGQQSVRHHLSALSGLFASAIGDGLLPMGHNPVANMNERPGVPKSTTKLIEAPDLALLLESARTLQEEVDPADRMKPLACAHAMLATYVYTGARDAEVKAMDVSDVHFATGYVEIRGTKTANADRAVPLHPALGAILREHVRRTGRIAGPLFVNERTGARVGSWRRTLDRIAVRAGFARGEVFPRRLRVSYATHRSTCNGISANELRLEMGHSASLAQLERVYAKAQRRGERMGDSFEFTVERYADELAPRMARLGTWGAARRAETAAERGRVVREFLAAVQGWSGPEVMKATGIPTPTVNRLRAGGAQPENVKSKTLDAIRGFLASGAARARAG
ncbi:MAG: recombinase XerC [Gemmatimonadetes bacterium]|nr:recombinase XerC [Gemmatimonadota bacterium]